MKALPAMLSLALCAPRWGYAEPPDEVWVEIQSGECGPNAPGYECFSKRELWESSVRYKGKWKDEQISHALTRIEQIRLEKKLAVRTSTAIPNLLPPKVSEGHPTSRVVLIASVSFLFGMVVVLLRGL